MIDLDVIGPIEGADGWHVNVSEAVMRPEWEPYRVDPEPATPEQSFSGPCGRAATVFLRFASEEEANAVLS